MQKSGFISIVLVLFNTCTLFAQNIHVTRPVITHFSADSKIPRPITIKTNIGTYTLFEKSLNVNGFVRDFEAFDGNGDKLNYTDHSYKGGKANDLSDPDHSYYHFSAVYTSKRQNSTSRSSGNSRQYSRTYSHSYNDPEKARERSELRKALRDYVPSYEGDYNGYYYSNKEEYLFWRLPEPPAPKAITNPEQYCGKWGDKYLLENSGLDNWTFEIKWDGNDFQFTFRALEMDLVEQENTNSWLFRSYSYTDKTPELQKKGFRAFTDDCDSEADPGFPDTGTYLYDEYYQEDYYRITLSDNAPTWGFVLGHTDYYYKDNHTYSETYDYKSLGVAPSPRIRFSKGDSVPANSPLPNKPKNTSYDDSKDNNVTDVNTFSYHVVDNDSNRGKVPEGVIVLEEAIPFALVEEKPKFQGGDANTFSKWVSQNLNYPAEAKLKKESGRVTVRFIVNQDGTISDVQILRSVSPSLDEEAIRVIQASPAWTPGKQHGRDVRVSYQFPVIFQLR